MTTRTGDPDPKIEPRPPLGTVFVVDRFERPSSAGIGRGFQPAGWFDFPNGGFECWVEKGIQNVRIDRRARTNGDAGIERHFAVKPGDVYRLTAWLRVASKTGKFKGRVNLSARRGDGSQVAEFNAAQEVVTETAVERSVEARMPAGAEFLSARVKFHTSSPGESGKGEIVAVTLERIPRLTQPVRGQRLSVYNFNIHKMQDDWRGWIRYIQDQKLAPPHVVLLQDIEHDGDRAILQKALEKSFGGTWSGRGSDRAWQTAIVWRAGRFSQPASRTWRGFGGTRCTDGSQDAPAVQVRLYDKVARRWISAVSLKTPPGVDDECVWRNVQKVNANFKPPWSGDVLIVGTDANSPAQRPNGDWSPWYTRAIRSRAAGLSKASRGAFCDPVADVCGRDASAFAAHATLGKQRVDYLLLRGPRGRPPKVVRQMTLPLKNAAGVKWSDHRSLHVEVAY